MPKGNTKPPRDDPEANDVLLEATKIIVGSVAAFLIFMAYRKVVFGY